MTDTVRSIVTTSLQWNKAYSPAEPILDSDAELCLDQFNAMLDSWSNESLSCFAIMETSFALVSGTSSYTIGTGGVINTTRPIRLIEGSGAAYLKDTNNQRYGVDVVTRDKWNLLGDLTVTSNVPDTLFYDNQFPLGIINVFPTPNMAYTMYFDSFKQLGNFTSLNSTFTLPPGYKAAITSNFSVWIKPFFKSAVIDADLKRTARESKIIIKRANRRTPIAVFDTGLLTRPNFTYDIYSDGRNN